MVSKINKKKLKSENGFMLSCEDHFSTMIKDLKKEDVLAGWCDFEGYGICDYPNCDMKAFFDVYWGNSGKPIKLKETKK